jgi:predicted dehydrogenase
MKLLVVGCGSIGKRHLRNLKKIAAGELLAFDTAPERRAEVEKEYGAEISDDFNEALSRKPDAALVCTPTSLHMEFALEAARHGCHLFIEKPISHTLEGVDDLINIIKEKGLIALVGCNFRFHWGMKLVRKLLDEGKIGRALGARAEFGQYLPDWHPWEDYRRGYSANRSMGGGILLDAIHEIDYIHWLAGGISAVSALSGKLSSLEIDTEDTAEILLRGGGGVIASVHMDYVRRDYHRRCELVGEKGTLEWSFHENLVRLFDAETKAWQTFTPEGTYDVNDMYVAEMEHLLRCVRGEETPALGAEEAKAELEIVLAAKESSATGRTVYLKGKENRP